MKAIKAHQVTKVFPARSRREVSLRRDAAALIQRYFQHQPDTEAFYALQDVSFSIEPGEAVALVGRNGSGKSTLLRLLAHIMVPTSGSVQVNGRCDALIGLGTGFHPELSGRENVFLSAAIRGLRPRAVRLLLDDIIEFAEIGGFIDQPVKTYSSGMSARLGFSVAVHLLPEIIFLDEILAVGDGAFQQRCIQRITQFKAEGRTIMIVSHALPLLETLCTRALWLDAGHLRMDGALEAVFPAYSAALNGGS